MYTNPDKAKTEWTTNNVHSDVGIVVLVNLVMKLYVMLLFGEVASVSSSG